MGIITVPLSLCVCACVGAVEVGEGLGGKCSLSRSFLFLGTKRGVYPPLKGVRVSENNLHLPTFQGVGSIFASLCVSVCVLRSNSTKRTFPPFLYLFNQQNIKSPAFKGIFIKEKKGAGQGKGKQIGTRHRGAH